MTLQLCCCVAILAFVGLLPALETLAADPSWPVRPIRILVPASAAGATDFVVRTYGQRLSEVVGQPVQQAQ
jgi:tripartite-type tricarboxylate transporter receptor subunit TctC